MKPGSLVVILPLTHLTHLGRISVSWLPVDDGKTEYVVSEIVTYPDGGVGVELEEGRITCRIGDILHIYAIEIEYVREVQPPGEVDVEAIVEESIYQLL